MVFISLSSNKHIWCDDYFEECPMKRARGYFTQLNFIAHFRNGNFLSRVPNQVTSY